MPPAGSHCWLCFSRLLPVPLRYHRQGVQTMSSYLTKCEIRGPACTCSTECAERMKVDGTTPAFVKHEVALIVKNICLTPYYKAPWNNYPRRSPSA